MINRINPPFKGWRTAAFMIPVFIIGAVMLVGLVVMLLWNGIMPEVFGLGIITVWQALGLIILGRILFGRSKRHKRHHYA